MENWIAVGDETGVWDIEGNDFRADLNGLAWVLGPVSTWERALQMSHGSSTALTVFSQSFCERLPPSLQLLNISTKYHVRDIWQYCDKNGLKGKIDLSKTHSDPVLELLRQDTVWLLQHSELGVLVVGGDKADRKAAGLGASGDGMRARARAYAQLMAIALPFLPDAAKMYLMAERRSEHAKASAVHDNRNPNIKIRNNRTPEPYRDFVTRLKEDLGSASSQWAPHVASGSIIKDFICKDQVGLAKVIDGLGVPFFKSRANDVAKAMNGIADLAAALLDRGNSSRLVVPSDYSSNYWTGSFASIRDAING